MTTTYSQMPSGRPLPGEFASSAAEDVAHVAGNGNEASVRGLAFHIAGHELRHLRAIEELYCPRRNEVLR